MRLREPTYRVTEGQAAVVCADIQSGVSDVAIVLSVSATQDTAQGQYLNVRVTIIFITNLSTLPWPSLHECSHR